MQILTVKAVSNWRAMQPGDTATLTDQPAVRQAIARGRLELVKEEDAPAAFGRSAPKPTKPVRAGRADAAE